MLTSRQASNAYAASASHRSLRDQEADVFRRTNAILRRGGERGGVSWVRALADNRRLWAMVVDLVLDPDNALPEELRASIVSVGLAVQREMENPDPDIAFLCTVNANMADGLSGER